MGRVACRPCGGYCIMSPVAMRHVAYCPGDVRCPNVWLPVLCVQNAVSICSIRMTHVLHSSQGLHLWCTYLPNAKRCVCLSPAECQIVPLCNCYSSDAALSPVFLPFTSCHIIRYSLRFGYIASHCIRFSIIVFYRSEVYCPILSLSSTMPRVLERLH